MRFAVAALALGCLLLSASCAGSQCTFNSQCASRHYCRMGSCYQDCRADIDCPSGRACSSIGQCLAPGEDGGHDPLDMGAGHDMPGVDTGMPPVDMGTPVDMTMPPTDMPMPPVDTGVDMPTPPVDGGAAKAYLADCTTDTECMSGHCIVELPSASHVCSKTCTSDTDCADWHYCLRPGTATSGAGVCAYDDTGATCSGTTGSCSFACLYSDPSPGHCTHLCSTASDCAGGYGCVYSTPGDTTSLKVCAWVHATCASPCDTTLGFCDPGDTQQCTGQCSSAADCPRVEGTPYTCGFAGASFNVCLPPTAGSGSEATGCSSDGDCRSGICAVVTAGFPAQCLERCDPRAGCGEGYACGAYGITAGFRNLCTPAGSGRAGDACTTERDCRGGGCGSSSHRCLDSCLNGFCPPGTTCTSDGLTVDGLMLHSCR